jgi:hypothetical protein
MLYKASSQSEVLKYLFGCEFWDLEVGYTGHLYLQQKEKPLLVPVSDNKSWAALLLCYNAVLLPCCFPLATPWTCSPWCRSASELCLCWGLLRCCCCYACGEDLVGNMGQQGELVCAALCSQKFHTWSHTHACAYTHTHTRTHNHTRTHTHPHPHPRTHTRTRIRTRTNSHAHTNTDNHANTHTFPDTWNCFPSSPNFVYFLSPSSGSIINWHDLLKLVFLSL